MKAKVLSVLLSVIIVAGMLLAATANAGVPELWFFEVQASGKGLEANTDSDPPPFPDYAETKHAVTKTPLYLMYDRNGKHVKVAYFVEVSGVWGATSPFSVIETGTSVLGLFTYIAIYIDWIDGHGLSAPIFAHGTFQIQFKEKNSAVSSARLKSIATAYTQSFNTNPEGEVQRFGALKMQGKMIDQADVPPAVLAAFGM